MVGRGVIFFVAYAASGKLIPFGGRGESGMPFFIIERNFAQQLEESRDNAEGIRLVNEDAGVSWLVSFLSADKKKTYCLYEAPSAEAIRRAAERANLPVDVITELSTAVRPDGTFGAITA